MCGIYGMVIISQWRRYGEGGGVGEAARPGCHHFGVTPFYDTNQTKKKTTLCLKLLEMFSKLKWTKK